jgi:hypothetical protein
MSKSRDKKFEDLWLSNIHPRSFGEEEEYGALKSEGNIHGVHRYLKYL